MTGVAAETGERVIQADLLANPKLRPRWLPDGLADPYSWRIFSGKWTHDSPHSVVYRQDATAESDENMAVVGPRRGHDFVLNIQFRFLTDSRQPPEGGAIIYLCFGNLKNHYSYHFCLSKQRVEFIKRRRGIWSILGGRDYELVKEQEYSVDISARGGTHECRIDGASVLALRDSELSGGRVGIGVKYCDVEFRQVLIASVAGR